MNFLAKAKSNSKKLTIPVVVSMVLLTTVLAIFPQLQYAQAKLTLADIFTGLRSKKVTLEERNKLLTEAIKSRGITFAITPDIEKELQETGAAKELIEAVKQKSVVVKTSATPVPVTTPVPTPAPTPSEPPFVSFQRKGDSNFVKGEYDLAVVNYTKAIDLNPKESSVYLSRGLVYYNRKFYELAIADYGKAIEIDPKETMAYYYRGDSYEKLGDLQKAVDDYKKIVELDASNESAKANVERLEAVLNKDKPKETPVSPTSSEPGRERVTNAETTNKIPEFAELGSLVGFAVKLAQPTYPAHLRNLRVEGEVTVNITIDEEGNPISIKAGSGHPFLRQVAEEAIRKSKFKPASVNNQPVKAKGFVIYKFRAN